VQHRDPVAEASPEPPHRLRRERDLGHEDDRPSPPLERRGAGLEIHLRLPAAGRAVEEHVPTAGVQRRDDPVDRLALGGRELLGLGLARERVAASARAGVEP
jgi:hypothetical protein